MKEIAAHQNEIDTLFDGVAFQHVDPRVKEIARAFGELITRAAQVHVGDVQKSHLRNSNISLILESRLNFAPQACKF